MPIHNNLKNRFFRFFIFTFFILFSISFSSIYVYASDPELQFNTFLGGSENDQGNVITHDASGNIYVAGYRGGATSFVSKLDNTGALLWNTYVGCGWNDDVRGIFIDNNGYIYISGRSEGSWGNPIRAYSGGRDAFVAKLNNSGVLQWTTFLGSSSAEDEGNGIKISSGGNIFVTGTSRASWGTPIRAFGGGSYDPFLVKLNSSGVLQWNTFLGGSGSDLGRDLVIDPDENIFLVGYAGSTWGSPIRAYSGGSYDAFVEKINNVGVIQWNTFLGGTNFDTGEDMVMDSNGNLYISGGTYTTTWGNPIRSFGGGWDSFVFKLNNSGILQWNTFLGGTGDDGDGDILVDSENNIYAISYSNLTWGSPLTAFSGNIDGSINKLSSDGSLIWNMFLGGSGNENAWGGTIDTSNNIYMTGDSSASWGNPVRAYYGFGTDAYVAKIKTTLPGSVVTAMPEGVIPVLTDDWSTDTTTTSQSGVQNLGVVDNNSTNRIAAFAVDFSSSLDWTNLTAESTGVKSVFHYPGGYTSLPGASGSSYVLYVPKGDGDRVLICPGADSLSAVSLSCSGGYYLDESSPNVTVATEGGVTYWKVSGLTGTGGMSVITGLRDTLSRLKVGTLSDHTLTFGTNYGLAVGTGYTMVLEFPDFDLTGLAITDIELTDNVGSVKTLAASAGADTWGAVINTGAKTITFSVPTSGTGGYAAASQIVIEIGLNATGGVNQITNPSSIGSYQEVITINNAAPGEMGIVNIPIIDSDTVDISGYVNAYMNFDIDTGATDIDCDFNDCLTHENGIQGSNYTVDLGELNSSIVNKSNTTAVMHSQGGMGIINSIYFDLSTNAPGGAVVSVSSLNGGLKGPGDNMLTSPGYDGFIIAANSGYYGYTVPATFPTATHGTVHLNGGCANPFVSCDFNQTKEVIFDTNGSPIENGRIRMDISAAAKYTNNPGVYTDTLTFVATGTF
jgi:hypothetical protein